MSSAASSASVVAFTPEKRCREDDFDEMVCLWMLTRKIRKREERQRLIKCVVLLSHEVMAAYERFRGGKQAMRVFELSRYRVVVRPAGLDAKMFRFLFRFERSEMEQLVRVLRVPDVIRASNGDVGDGLEVMCMLTMKYAFPTRLGQLIPFFGYSVSKMSRLISALRLFLFSEHAVALQTIPQLSFDDLQRFAKGVQGVTGFPLCFGFIDGTVRPVCKPGLLQGEVFNGKDHVHSLKYQGMSTPDGMLQQLAGPWPGRRHDSVIYSNSGLPEWLLTLPRHPSNAMFVLYADAGYHSKPGLMVPFTDTYDLRKEAFNDVMTSARIAIEWEFGGILQHWASLNWTNEQKLLGGGKIAQVYFVCGFLTNCINCMRPNNASQYFNVKPPMLEDYVESIRLRKFIG